MVQSRDIAIMGREAFISHCYDKRELSCFVYYNGLTFS